MFGLTADQVMEWGRSGYKPREIYEQNQDLKDVIDLVASGFFSPERSWATFKPLVDSLLNEDRYFVLADFAAYVKAQEDVARMYQDADGWAKKAILNVARVGRFSSDRTIRQYASRKSGT